MPNQGYYKVNYWLTNILFGIGLCLLGSGSFPLIAATVNGSVNGSGNTQNGTNTTENSYNSINNQIYLPDPIDSTVIVTNFLEHDFDLDGEYERYFIKGVAYQPMPVGRTPSDKGYFNEDPDPRPDNIYDEEAILDRDFKWLKLMNANTIRIWRGNDLMTPAGNYPVEMTELLLDKAEENGIKVIAGFWIDPIGHFEDCESTSGYIKDIDIENPDVRVQLTEKFRMFVEAFKDHPAILFWVIGNGNNVSLNPQDPLQIKAWYSLANEMALAAHLEEGESYHPVALENDGLNYIGIPYYETTDYDLRFINIWGIKSYPGESFGSLFTDYHTKSYKPVWISDFGVDAWSAYNPDDPQDGYEDQEAQAYWLKNLWNEIYAARNFAAGGTINEYSDEWWRAPDTDCSLSDTECLYEHDYSGRSQTAGCPNLGGGGVPAVPDEYYNDEWWGIFSVEPNLEDPYYSPDDVTPRDVFYDLQNAFLQDDINFSAGEAATVAIPIPNSNIVGPSEYFYWYPIPDAQSYTLTIFNTRGEVLFTQDTTDFSLTIADLPYTNETVFALLETHTSSRTYSRTTSYNLFSPATEKAALTEPSGGWLPGSDVTFRWDYDGGLDEYYLRVGTTPGGNDLGYGHIEGAKEYTVKGLPTGGTPVYVRLLSFFNNSWQASDYVFNGYLPACTVADYTPEQIKPFALRTGKGVSGVTYNPDAHEIFIVDNNNQAVYRYAGYLDEYIRGYGLSADDPEAITYIGNNRYGIVDEDTARLNIVEFLGNEFRLLERYNITSPSGNAGLEGLVYDASTGHFFVSKQASPMVIFEVAPVALNEADVSVLINNAQLSAAGVTNISGLTLNPANGNIVFVNRGVNKLFEFERNGNFVASVGIGNFAQAEGVAFLGDGRILVVGESRQAGYLAPNVSCRATP